MMECWKEDMNGTKSVFMKEYLNLVYHNFIEYSIILIIDKINQELSFSLFGKL